ncbi:hypothetical protein [Sphingopyxis terrae]|uniref:hypothetical protein n=1 Tax=Sphingopyxis terrae TaxID=33052 RepID=UPI000B01B4FD|nr:hypothetical protein [Sphingopyxis terrae]
MTQPKSPARPAPPRDPALQGPAPQSLIAALSAFTPAQLQRRRSTGWTPDRQRKFIEALAATACVTEAAASVGLSATSAYNLRRRPEAHAFRHAWDAAIDCGMRRLVDAALARAVHGVPVPIFYKGEQVGERREYPERLAMFLMRAHDPRRFAAAGSGDAGRGAAPADGDPAEARLTDALARIGAPTDDPPSAPLRLPGPAADDGDGDSAEPSD